MKQLKEAAREGAMIEVVTSGEGLTGGPSGRGVPRSRRCRESDDGLRAAEDRGHSSAWSSEHHPEYLISASLAG